MYDAPSFFSLALKISSCTLSCDIWGISLIYVSPTSEYGGGKLIKQFSQPANTSFFHLGTHLFYIEGNGKEGKVHDPNTASGSIHLCPLCFRPSSEQSSSLAFCRYLLSLWFSSIVLFPFALKHRHLSGQPSHLTALYLAFSLTYPDAVFTRLVPILRIFCPMGQMQKSCSSL